MTIRAAVADDSCHLAYLINLAGEGIPACLWRQLAPDQPDPLVTGSQRASRRQGGFSYRNAMVAEEAGEILGMVLHYRLDDPYDIGDIKDYPEVVRPAVELESLVPGSWYINAIATYEAHRRKGVAASLMDVSEQVARDRGCRTLSLIVTSQNRAALNFYKRRGFRPYVSRPSIPFEGFRGKGDWLLLIKHSR